MCVGFRDDAGGCLTMGRRRLGRGRLEGRARPAVLECGVLRARCRMRRVARRQSERLIRSSNAVGRAGLRAIDAICGKGTGYEYASAL